MPDKLDTLADTTAAMEFTALAWNLFHGRDHPPDPALRTWRSRLLRFDERSETHVQVNRDLTAAPAEVDWSADGKGFFTSTVSL